MFCVQGTTLLSQGHLWWSELVMVFRWGRRHRWRDSLHCGWGGERYKTLQGLQSRSRGKWNMENVTGVFWHFALWASLKRFKHQLRSESGSYEYESPAWEEMLRFFYPVYFRGVNIYMEINLRGFWHFTTLSVARNIVSYFNCGSKIIFCY